MKNRGSTPILPNLVGVHLRNIHTKFEANPCRGSREEVNNEILHSDIRPKKNMSVSDFLPTLLNFMLTVSGWLSR